MLGASLSASVSVYTSVSVSVSDSAELDEAEVEGACILAADKCDKAIMGGSPGTVVEVAGVNVGDLTCACSGTVADVRWPAPGLRSAPFDDDVPTTGSSSGGALGLLTQSCIDDSDD